VSKFIGAPMGYRKDGSPILQVRGAQDIEGVEAPIRVPNINTPPAPAPEAPKPTSQTFTLDDLNKAREEVRAQEKSKMYGRVETLAEEVKRLSEERDARLAEQTEAQQRATEEARRREEAELSFQDLLAKRDQEFEAKIEAIRQEQAQKEAILEKERQYHELSAYRTQKVAEYADHILPELQSEVSGNSIAEIDASIARLADLSASIMNNVAQSFADQRQAQPGTSPTGRAAIGPLENETGQKQYTPEDIRAMSWDEYQQVRSQLGIGQSGTNRGLFG
jgi:hypothetical protein